MPFALMELSSKEYTFVEIFFNNNTLIDDEQN